MDEHSVPGGGAHAPREPRPDGLLHLQRHTVALDAVIRAADEQGGQPRYSLFATDGDRDLPIRWLERLDLDTVARVIGASVGAS